MTTNEYQVRFDLDMDRTLEKPFIDFLCEFAIESTLIVVFENPRGDNPHLHGMFSSFDDTKKIRNRLLYLFKKSFKDKKSYCLNQKPGNLLYLCKGHLAISKIKDPKYPGERAYPTVVFNGGFLEDEISRLHEEWWEQAKHFKVGKVEKEKKLTMLEKYLEHIEKDALGIDGKLKPDYTQKHMERALVKYMGKRRILCKNNGLDEYSRTIWLILLDTYDRGRERYEQHVDLILYQLDRYRENKY